MSEVPEQGRLRRKLKLVLATTWSVYQPKIHKIKQPTLGLTTLIPLTEAGRNVDCNSKLQTWLIAKFLLLLVSVA